MDLNFDTERALLQQKRAELLAGIALIEDALAALDQGQVTKQARTKVTGSVIAETPVRAGRRPMSPADRKAASDRMKKYWAAKRKAAKVARQ